MNENRICQNCYSNFEIEPEDFQFYEKIEVPPPTWCPECRIIRRMSWREERTLYKATCELCEKKIISIHAPDGPFIIYCRDCWKSDKWDPRDYGQDYDFNKPFFLQYRELMERTPRPALTGSNMKNSQFSHACESVKNCYLCSWSYFAEDSAYSDSLLLSKNCFDCFVIDNSDQVYESLHSNRLYKINFGYFSDDCLSSNFILDCLGCSDCFGCINQRKQKYRLWNKQLTKTEFQDQIKYWDLGSFTRLEEAKKKFKELYLQTPRRYARIINSENVTGDIMRDTKNCQSCFTTLDGVQNCKYVYFGGLNLKDSYDVTVGGATSELMYETYGVTSSNRVMLSAGGANSHDTIYCDWAENSSYLFGCTSLKNKQFCILNKQFTKDEFNTLVPKIKEHMNQMPYIDKKGRIYKYGEFFPSELSAFAYNESQAFTWAPKTESEAMETGLPWRKAQTINHEINIQAEELPDHIREIDESVLQKNIGCRHQGKCNEKCTIAFRITPEELNFYQKNNLALPRLCPNCRYRERLNWRNNFKIWERSCACAGPKSQNDQYQNLSKHFHNQNPCDNKFSTTFSPQNPEIIYCKNCYQQEFI